MLKYGTLNICYVQVTDSCAEETGLKEKLLLPLTLLSAVGEIPSKQIKIVFYLI